MSFQKVEEAVQLFIAGRTNAAKATWQSLCEEFRILMLEYVLDIIQRPELISSCPNVELDSKWGNFKLSSQILATWAVVIPKLV